MEIHFEPRFPCSKCDGWLSRKDLRDKHLLTCTGTLVNVREEKPLVWTVSWPEELKEPPVGDSLRQYFIRFGASKGDASGSGA